MVKEDSGHQLACTDSGTTELEVVRFSSGVEDTLGLLFEVTHGYRKFLCFTLEDEHRTQKVYGETRIPAGRYQLGVRDVGGFHQKYSAKFGAMHRGMIQVLDVPGFDFILLHIGNDDEDTAGCLLLGNTCVQNVTREGRILKSTDAYLRVYPQVMDAIEAGPTFITYVDFD